MSLVVICSLFFGACDVKAFADTGDPDNALPDSSNIVASDNVAGSFTGELLSDGLVLLKWPRDPSAISYIVIVNGKLSASLPASELSAVVETEGSSAVNGKFTIESVNVTNVRSEWASKPLFIRAGTINVDASDPETVTPVEGSTQIEDAPPIEEPVPNEYAAPVEDPTQIEGTPSVEEPAPNEYATPVEDPTQIEGTPSVEESAPNEYAALVEDPTQIEDVPSVEEPAPNEYATPVKDPTQIEDVTSVEEPVPNEYAAPVEDPTRGGDVPSVEEPAPNEYATPVEDPTQIEVAAPSEGVAVVELVNLAPDITDTSYNCDPVFESLTFDVGQTDFFTLSVTDESPLTLAYSVDSSKQGILNVTVDGDGVFTVSALQAGDTFLWLYAEDDAGLVDEYELRVVVQ